MVDDGRGRYRRFGKIETAMTDEEFKEGMETGKFVHRKHKGYCVLLFYTGVRKLEAGNAKREQFQITKNMVIYNVSKRLKGSAFTPQLPLPRSLPFMDELVWAVENTEAGAKVWDYSPKTYYNIVRRAFDRYPHLCRLTRITNFFEKGFDIAKVRSWTGLTLAALEYYVGVVDVAKMGKALKEK